MPLNGPAALIVPFKRGKIIIPIPLNGPDALIVPFKRGKIIIPMPLNVDDGGNNIGSLNGFDMVPHCIS